MLNLRLKLDPLSKKLCRRISKYPPQTVKNFEDVVKELAEGEIPRGRRMKLLKGFDNVYSLRLDGGYRVAIEVDGKGWGRVVHIDTRGTFYEEMNRRR